MRLSIRLSANGRDATYKVANHNGFILLTRLRVGFSHLREHKFRHSFQDTVDPFCSCRTNSIECTEHYLLHCSNHANERLILIDNLMSLNINFFPLKPSSLSNLLLYGDSNFDTDINHSIVAATIDFIIETDRFSGPLFN